MVKFFESIYLVLSRRKRTATVVLLLLIALFVGFSLQIHEEEDIAKFLPRNEQNEKYTDVYQQLSRQDQIVVIFSSRDTMDVVSADTIITAMEQFAEQCEKEKVGKSVSVHADETRMMEMMDFVTQHIPYFLTDDDYARIDTLLQVPDYIAEQLTEDKKLLNLPTAGISMERLRYDPVQLFSPVLLRMQDFNRSQSFEVIDGCVFTHDGRSGLAFLESPYGTSESANNAALQTALERIMGDVESTFPQLRVSAIGASLVAAGNARQIKHDSMLAVTIAVILILVVLILHYRRLADLWWLGSSLVFGWLFALAGMSLFHDSMSVIVLGIGSVIIGIAVNYPLHYLDHLREIGDTQQTLREMVPPLLIGNITTVSAFLCLVWLDAAAMRDLGLFGSLMLVGTILFVLVFLPLYAKATSSAKHCSCHAGSLVSSCRNVFSASIKRLLDWASRPLGLVMMVLVTVVLAYFSLQTSFDSDLRNINYMTDQQRSDMQMLTAISHEAPVYAVAEGQTLEEALRKNESEVLPMLVKMKQDGIVKKVSGVGYFVPTTAMQEERLKRWKEFCHAHGQDLVSELRRQCALQGFNEQAFTPFFEMLEDDHAPQPLSFFQPVTDLLQDTYLFQDEERGLVRVVNFIQTDQKMTVKESLNAKAAPATYAFSSEDIGNQLVQILSDSFNYIGFVCAFVVFLFLWLSFGSIELSLMSFLPLAVSWLWILGLMHLFGVQFNIVNIILATFIFGQGDDYTIFITEGLMYEYSTGRKRLASYQRSVALSAILMFIGIGTLIFAKHPALRSLAAVTIIGMFTVVLMAYYLPPLVFRWLTRGVRTADPSSLISHLSSPLPITLGRFCRSLFAIVFFLLMMYLFMLPFTWLYFRLGKNSEEKKLRYHRLLQRVSDFVIHHVPGVQFALQNRVGETFENPAVVICNHQSHLDLMCLMMLTPRIVFLTNDWVWHNPFYGMVIHRAEFYPVSDGIEAHLEQLRSLYQRGYSICIFPEGTRSPDGSILRFHKGAFYLAEQLHADILPIFLHGAGHVLPKKDFMLRQGRIDVEVQERIPWDDPCFSTDLLTRTKQIRAYYRNHYSEMCERIETDEYLAPYRRYIEKYMTLTDQENR